MTSFDPQQEGLAVAAESLESALQRFEQIAQTMNKTPLSSQKNLERAAKLLNDLAGQEGVLEERVKELVQQIGRARARQEEHTRMVQERAKLIEQRAAALQQLMDRYGGLGRSAGELNATVGSLGQPSADAFEKSPDVRAQLGAVNDRLGQIIQEAMGLAEEAVTQEFPEMARQVDSLVQQLRAAKNRLGLLSQKLTEQQPEASA